MKLLAALAVLLVACGDATDDTANDVGAPSDASLEGGDGGNNSDATSVDGNPDGAPGDGIADGSRDGDSSVGDTGTGEASLDTSTPACGVVALGTKLGRDKLMIGGQMADATFGALPFDLRYLYIAGPSPAAPCAKCDASCSALSTWWGCWGDSAAKGPGAYVTAHITNTHASGAIPMISYYRWYSVAGEVELAPEIAAMNKGENVTAYMEDYQFFMRTIGATGSAKVIVHLEPDLWGFAAGVNKDPSKIPAAVSAAGIPACSALPNTVTGFARCMLAIARSEAPNAVVAFHASSWGDGADVYVNTDPTYNVLGHADRTAAFLTALGAGDADLVVVEMSNHDAGSDGRYWAVDDSSLPDFKQAMTWVGEVGKAMKLPTLWWQIPYGNLTLPNTCSRYKDNRVQYIFDHADRFAAIGSLGVAFGQALDCMTNDLTDGGYFKTRATAYFSSASSKPSLACAP